MEEKCSVGEVLEDECHRETYSRKTGLRPLDSLPADMKEKILWRCGLSDHIFAAQDVKICFHHEQVYGRVFERRVPEKCCDVFNTHQKKAKGHHIITLELAKKLKEDGYEVKPGWKLCRNCYDEARKQNDDNIETLPDVLESTIIEATVCEDDEEQDLDISREELNKSFQYSGVSPIKLHGATKARQIATTKEKLQRVKYFHEKQAARVIGVEVGKVKEKSLEDEIRKEEREKAAELDKLHFLLKEKIAASTKREKIKLLTLVPDSWSRKQVAEFFNVTEYLVRAARRLKKEKGILAEPERKAGKSLPDATITLVKAFYEDDEFSRMMPGKKDYVSVGKNTHMQKRLLLCNLSELYSAFKEKNPGIKVGFSKFCSLRPKWCILTDAPGTHSVCVCAHHQNAVLLVSAVDWDFTYKDLMKVLVCDTSNLECMVHRCEKCPGKVALTDLLWEQLSTADEDNISFQQWQSTDRSTLVAHTSSVQDYISYVVQAIDQLTAHSFIAKCQSTYLKECKEHLDNNTCIILMDFAENYQYVIQDEIQSFHWNNQQCTLHPVVIYYRGPTNDVDVLSVCIISDDNEHDTCFVHEVQHLVTDHLKANLPHISNIQYFTDGCAGQYKNYKNFLNLIFHKEDFGIGADWSFFATSHGKSPCDGVGGTIKRLVARASLQRPLNDQIITFEAFANYVNLNIKSVKFFSILSKDMDIIRHSQKARFEIGKTIPGTRSYHYFQPTDNKVIKYKRTSINPAFEGEHSFNIEPEIQIDIEQCKLMTYVSCKYDSFWWIGMIKEIDRDNNEIRVHFMHPHGPSRSFFWPTRIDSCWVPMQNVLCKVDIPLTVSGRTYTLKDTDLTTILKCLDS